jgi:transposase-like protein
VTDIVSWAEIDGKCGSYKENFVAVYREYQGRLTDEIGEDGRRVKVTQKSFARHLGIGETTFSEWIRRFDGAAARTFPDRDKHSTRETRAAKTLAKEDPHALAKAIEEAGPQAMDNVYDELKLRRAGVDTSEAARKAAVARTHRDLEPVRRSMATSGLALAVQAIKDATEHLREAISADAVTSESMAEVTSAYDELTVTIMEANMRVP